MKERFWENLEGWVFDLDGVLVDTERLHFRAWQEAATRRGGTILDEWLPGGVGVSDLAFWRSVAPQMGFDPGDESIIREKSAILETIVDDEGAAACPGADALLRAFGDRWPLALATSSRRSFVERVLEKRGWLSVFQRILCREDVARPKPDPEIYRKAAERLGIAADRCAAVEDSPPGLAAANAAGLRTIGVTTNFSRDAIAQARWVVDSLEEVLASAPATTQKS